MLTEARRQYQEALDTKIDYEVLCHNRWTVRRVAEYRRVVEAFWAARRRLFLDEPDERFYSSIWWQCRGQMPVAERVALCEREEARELARLECAA